LASSMALRVRASVSPSSRVSTANEARLRVPARLPAGLPLWPTWNCPELAMAYLNTHR
jgi:hypothetical protein